MSDALYDVKWIVPSLHYGGATHRVTFNVHSSVATDDRL